MNNYLLMHEAAYIYDFSSSQTFSTNTYFLCVWVY